MPDGGAAVKYGKTQIAVFNFTSRREWYATQNMCPHKQAFVLSRGIVGDTQGTPKVVCPLHKKNFALETGACLSEGADELLTFPVRIDDDRVCLELPPQEQLDARLGTDHFCDRGAGPRGPEAGTAAAPVTPYLRVEDTNGQVDYFGARAREAGMLSQGHQGQHGGAMTDKAEQLLASRQRKYKKR